MDEEKFEIYRQIIGLIEENKIKALGGFLDLQRASDIAEAVELLDKEQKRVVFTAMIDKELAAEVLEKVTEATRAELFDEVLENKEIVDLVAELPHDEAADVLEEMGDEESQEILAKLDDEDAKQIKDLMKYEEDSAGGIMQPMILAVENNLTVQQTIDRIRQARGEEEFYCIFVVDNQRHFLGTVGIRHLLSAPPQTLMGRLVNQDTIVVHVDTDQEEIRNLFKKNNLLVAPVVDDEGRLAGGITADRIIEVAEEEAAEDIYTIAGTAAEEREKFSAVHAARVRMTWLTPCLLGSAITAIAGFFFRNLFIQSDLMWIFITAFMFVPMIAAISGTAGLQTSAVVTCGLATGNLAAIRMGQVFWREVRVALLVALLCGIAAGLIGEFLPRFLPPQPGFVNQPNGSPVNTAADQPPAPSSFLTSLKNEPQLQMAAALGLAMFSAIMVSTTLGLFLPFVFRRIGIDPAISSGPLVTTTNDLLSITIYMVLTLWSVR